MNLSHTLSIRGLLRVANLSSIAIAGEYLSILRMALGQRL